MAKPIRPDDLLPVLQRHDADAQFSHLIAQVWHLNHGRRTGHNFNAVLNPMYTPFPRTDEPHPQHVETPLYEPSDEILARLAGYTTGSKQ